ncbi:Methyltransferase domain-containing protein [Methanobrevibacter olleyae]|uniref:Methyltransferase domain-containing protein n=1 Tax=Methanobrevibacter olleyae TaxID=294671 RepID=A0A1I4IBF2_METOL|nr:methyltransferase domain-containing protein [Methanobrevibacter olleyae]SFL51397.1 Methyltransferase domain-containing protein [Methanobrevibacter olleyae]
MANKTGILPANGHRIQGRSSESFLNAHDIIMELNLKGNEVFMDAGCGDGHAALEAVEILDDDATIYAIDIYEPSIEDLIKEKEEKAIDNLFPICADISDHIDLDDDLVDVILLINVWHGFKATRRMDKAIEELKRILKPSGKLAIMDYKKQEARHGPPITVRSSPEDLEEVFKEHGMDLFSLNPDTGEDIPQGKSHYLIVFQK